MNVAIRKPAMSRTEFLDWVQAQETRYEFDGTAPVAMTGGSVNHNRIVRNIHRALYTRLTGSPCEPFGPDDGLATIADIVRYPDAFVSCTKADGRSRLVAAPVIVFEVLSPGNGWVDRIVKLQEYLAVPSIHTYVIVEQDTVGLTVMTRRDDNTWTAEGLRDEGILRLHAPELEIPLATFYENVDLQAG